MNDKQKLALKELADVMEKHGITFESSDTVWVFLEGDDDIVIPDYQVLDAEDIREALKDG